MKQKIMAKLKALFRFLDDSEAKAALMQERIEAARVEFYRKHPETFLRRGIL